MKHLILLIALISFSANAQEKPLHRQVASVTEIIGNRALLSAGKYIHFNVPVGDYEKSKECLFYLEITGCEDCDTKQAIVKDWVYTTGQIQRDQEALAKKYKDRKILTK